MNRREYDDAAKKFIEVDRQHPYSEWARKSLLMTAYAFYENGKYDDTIQAARRYVTLHPGSPDAAYAQYLMASSFFDQIPDITRDQGRTERALTALDEVMRKYPNTEYAESAKKKLEIARDQLAGKEMMIGRWYLERRNYIGGINRFKTVVTVPDHATRGRGADAAHEAIWRSASWPKRRPRRPCSGTISDSPGTRTPSLVQSAA
jgi:outer membrane protein assembly factor BamD